MFARAAAIISAAFLSACSGERASDPPVQAPPAPVAPATADDPAAYRGAALAHQVCSRCHDIGAGAASAEQVGAPDFGDLAKQGLASQGELNAASLATWMRASHPDMPNYMLGDADIADLAAYIISLRTPD